MTIRAVLALGSYFNGPLVPALIIFVLGALTIWTLVTAAQRGRWGWFLFVFFMPGLAVILFWLVNPGSRDSGPRAA
jgi:hypothetical protein